MKFSVFAVLTALVILVLYVPKASFESQETDYVSIPNGTKYPISYSLTGGEITSMFLKQQPKEIAVTIQSSARGNMTIDLPRRVIDATSGGDDTHFIVLVNGHGAGYQDLANTTNRVLTIPYPNGTSNVEVRGTQVIPEFGPVAPAIFIGALMFYVIINRYKPAPPAA